MPYVANGGTDGFTDETEQYAVCARAFDRVIDISEVKSLLLWPDDEGGKEKVEVDLTTGQ